MRRTTIILVAVLILLIGAGTYLWMTKTKIAVPWIKETNTTTTSNKNLPANTNQAVINAPVTNTSLPTEVKGDTTFSGSLTVGDVPLTLSSLQWTNTYVGLKAGAGKKLLVVFIDPIPYTKVASVLNGMSKVSLATSGGAVALSQDKVAGDTIKNDRGYLLFEVPTTAKDLFIVNGSGPTAQRISVPVAK